MSSEPGDLEGTGSLLSEDKRTNFQEWYVCLKAEAPERNRMWLKARGSKKKTQRSVFDIFFNRFDQIRP